MSSKKSKKTGIVTYEEGMDSAATDPEQTEAVSESPEKKTRKPNLSDMDFVTAYLDSKSNSELMEKTGLSSASVFLRRKKLIAAGVKLEKYGRASKGVDVDALNATIESRQQS
jgi:hypothetical protein